MIVETPEVGDVGLVKVAGLAGKFIYWGQRLNGSSKQNAKYEHSMLLVGPDRALEAEPGGAVISRVSARYGAREITWVRVFPDLTIEEKLRITSAAAKLVGTPYSFLDYVALFGLRYKLPMPGLKRYISDTRHQICSQIIDYVFTKVGRDAFPEKWSGYVTPANYMEKFGGEAS